MRVTAVSAHNARFQESFRRNLKAMVNLRSRDEQQTARLGAVLGPQLRSGDLVLLEGNLGAGKTSLARAIIRGMAGAPIDVPSPTFGLIESYDFETPLYHVDLYRLDDADQALELGLEDMMDAGIMLIEWPERVPWLSRGPRLEIRIEAKKDGTRMIRLTPHGGDWAARLTEIEAELCA
ncbi:MAG: tRNA (adenosine(37)-N6)-threonylcarbamoyltransferase complex ATPase subunit type 1 TsaE [Pseudomonadota bacterium]